MSSSESDASDFEDIKVFFPSEEWKDLCSYEKKSYRNAKDNYHNMQRCGLAPKPPGFMTRTLPQKRQQKSQQPQVKKKAAKKRKGEEENYSDDEKDLDWSPTKENSKERPKPAQQKSATIAPAPPLPRAAGKENVDPVASTSSTPKARTRNKRCGPRASTGAPPAPPGPPSAGAPGAPRPTRYPKRAGSRRSYAEPELQDDDDFLFCDDCQKEWEGDCPVHGALEVIADTEVPVGHPERALLTVPPQLAIEVSKIPGAGRGVWTRQAVPRRVRFGPYEGDNAPTNKETGYGWEIRREGKATHCVDALDMTKSNWMRFVNCARHSGEENLYPYQYKGRLYYRVVRDIPPNTELLVWYGDSYGKELGLDPKVYKDPTQDTRAL
ncbi:histone-lysine N-methyltransferase PRDM7-like, partial [Frankliniella occidentalis]|uniref:Histone-lysine N-methyltransferase PRDM7-like n=1 Tax=Frankliniella occidentalis TaxID=133901 RepID=A0A9C6XBD5_FRAOC